MSRLYTIRRWEFDKVSPLAARLSTVAYILGYVCLIPVLFGLGVLPLLWVLGIVPGEQSGSVQLILLLVMLITSLPTIATSIVALRLMRNVSATIVEKERAKQAMIIGFVILYIPLGFLYMALFSGGHL